MNHQDAGKIAIDLRESLEARDFPYNESFFQDELDQAVSKIERLVERSQNMRKIRLLNDLDKEHLSAHFHDSISVLGKRGIGKTSFLLTLRRHINEGQKELADKLFFLPIIDPGMLEDGEYLLATLTSLLCQQIQDHDHFLKVQDGNLLGQWEESLKDLCDRFIALDGKAYREHMARSFQSPEFLGNHALVRGCSGILLSQKFGEFVARSIEVLSKLEGREKHCLVLMIDDIDTVYDRCWLILETIRKYLTTEQIIVVAAGDTELFKLVIRNQLFNKSQTAALAFDKNLISSKDIAILKDVEWQYQLKLFPLLNRINLPIPSAALLTQPEKYLCRYTDVGKKDEQGKNIRDTSLKIESLPKLFARFISTVFKYQQGDHATSFIPSNPYTSLIPQTNRVLLQLLQSIVRPRSCDRYISDLSNLFTNELREYDFDPVTYNLDRPRDEELFKIIVKILGRKIKQSESSINLLNILSLQPRHELSDRINKAILFFNALLCNIFTRKPMAFFDYWISFISPAILSSFLTRDGTRVDMIDDMIAQASQPSSLPEFVSKMMHKIHDVNTSSQEQHYYRRGPGFLRLTNDSEEIWRKALRQEKLEYLGINPWLIIVKRELPKVETESDRWKGADLKRQVVQALLPDWRHFKSQADPITLTILIPFVICITDVADDHFYVDFQRGIAVINEIIKSAFEMKNKDIIVDAITRKLSKWSSFTQDEGRSPTRFFQDIALQGENIEENPNNLPFPAVMINALDVWLKNYRNLKIAQYPIEIISNIWINTLRRLHSFSSMEKNPDFLSVGKLLNQSTISFLYSILVEEIRINRFGQTGTASYNEYHPSQDFNQIISFLESAPKKMDLSFFKFWLNCPFLNVLLENDQVEALEKINEKRKLDFVHFKYIWKFNVPGFSSTKTTIQERVLSKGIRKPIESTAYKILCALMPAKYPKEEKATPQEVNIQATSLTEFLLTKR